MKRILIVKLGAIGDVVMALSLLTYFRRTSPQAHITWVCGNTVVPILRLTQKVDEIIALDERSLFKGSLLQQVKELICVQAKLANKSFDLIFTGHTDQRYRLISLFAKGKKRRFLPVAGRYHGDEYVRLVSGVDNVAEENLPEIEWRRSEHVDRSHLAVVLAPGGAKNMLANDALRRWPITYYVELVKKFEAKGIQVILTGAVSDAWVSPFFQDLSCKNLIGTLDILELIRLYQNANLLITHDSGPLHLAKLAKCPAIGLFGPTNPSEKVGKKDPIQVLWGGEHLPCRPCYDGKRYAACKENRCLQQIAVEQVFQRSLKLLIT